MSGLESELHARLAEFDGRAMTVLGEAEAALGKRDGYIDALIALSGEGEGFIASGATWLLKAYLEQGGDLDDAQTASLCDQLGRAEDWQAHLHLCQSMQFLTIADNRAAGVAAYLTPLLDHDRPFLRAWSLDALAHLANAHGEFQNAFAAAWERALDDSAASVRARARKL